MSNKQTILLSRQTLYFSLASILRITEIKWHRKSESQYFKLTILFFNTLANSKACSVMKTREQILTCRTLKSRYIHYRSMHEYFRGFFQLAGQPRLLLVQPEAMKKQKKIILSFNLFYNSSQLYCLFKIIVQNQHSILNQPSLLFIIKTSTKTSRHLKVEKSVKPEAPSHFTLIQSSQSGRVTLSCSFSLRSWLQTDSQS